MAKTNKEISLIISGIKKELGPTKPVVLHSNPFKTLVSTVLSARTKDETTFPASLRLFRKFHTPEKLSKAKLTEIEKLIFPVGFYKTKARHIKELSKILIEDYNSKVPKEFTELVKLPGVGRKTANIVLSLSFKIPAIAVDTHVHRISNRLGLVDTNKPEKTEQELMLILPKKYWLEINELLVKFGQQRCKPINPECHNCPILNYCDYGKTVFKSR